MNGPRITFPTHPTLAKPTTSTRQTQPPHNCENAAICSSDPLAGVILRGVHIEVGAGIPRHEKGGAAGRIPIDFVIDNNWLLCADTARCSTFFLCFALCNLDYPS